MSVILSWKERIGAPHGDALQARHEGKVLEFIWRGGPNGDPGVVLLDTARKFITVRGLAECHFEREES